VASGQNGVSPPEARDRTRGWWATHIRPHLLPVLLGVIPALLITALTPLGEGLRELLFPTRVTVAGTLDLPQGNFPNLELVLDDDTRVTPEGSGAFEFDGVPNGNHTISVDAQGLSDGVIASFSVASRSEDIELEELQADPAVTLVGDGSAGYGSGASLVLEFILWVEGSAAELQAIEQVDYVTPAWLSPKAPEPTTIRAENFCMHFLLQMETVGSWPQPTARAHFSDGGELVIRMSGESAPSTPTPACSKTFEGDGGPGDTILPAENLLPPGFGFVESGTPGNGSQAQYVTVPPLVRLSRDVATGLVYDVGLVPEILESSSAEPPGTVIAQQPPAFELILRGSTVVITVAAAAEPAEETVPIPDVIGLSYGSAKAELSEAGLVAVPAVYEGGCGMSPDHVCKQDPEGTQDPNHFVELGTTVTLFIQAGVTPSP
jgi:PASTA domain